MIERALSRTDQNKGAAARLLGLKRHNARGETEALLTIVLMSVVSVDELSDP